MIDADLRRLIPRVLSVLVHRGADFATAEDAVQDALIRALSAWPSNPPENAEAWLITVSWRIFLDRVRSDTARRHREERFGSEPPTAAAPSADDTLELYFLTSLSPLSSTPKPPVTHPISRNGITKCAKRPV